MTKINKISKTGLTKEKKLLLKAMKGKCSTPIDFNKVRDEYRHGKD